MPGLLLAFCVRQEPGLGPLHVFCSLSLLEQEPLRGFYDGKVLETELQWVFFCVSEAPEPELPWVFCASKAPELEPLWAFCVSEEPVLAANKLVRKQTELWKEPTRGASS